jgi:hypothetical protein
MISTAFSPVMLSCHMPANKTTHKKKKKKKKKGVVKNDKNLILTLNVKM